VCARCRIASIAKLAGEQMQPYVAQLIPKLFRYQHDPNPAVREAMTAIWRALVPPWCLCCAGPHSCMHAL
jgi:hypothetical protein